MVEPLAEDSAIVFTFIKSYSGITGNSLILETGFDHDRVIDAVKALVLRGMVHVDLTNYPNFRKCRLYPKV